MAIIHGSYSVVELAVLILWAFATKCTAMTLPEMDRAVGALVEAAMTKAQVTVLDFCTVTKMEEANFRKALKGEQYRHIAVIHIIRVGIAYPMFAVHFTADLMWFVVKHRATEIVETVTVRKGA